MTGRRIALASSSFITSKQYSFNNSIVYIPPTTQATSSATGEAGTQYLGLDKQEFVIMIVVVCGGGAFLLMGFGICICCYMRIRRRKHNNSQTNRTSQQSGRQNQV